MLPEDRDAAYLWDMLNNTKKSIRALQDISLQDYLVDEDLRLIIERRIEIIGEAAGRVGEAFRAEHPEVPWKSIIGQRNVMAHQYDEIDHERIWILVKDHLPALVQTLEKLVPPPPQSEET